MKMKEVILKVNGNLYVGNNLPENFGEQCIELRAFARGMGMIQEKIGLEEICVDKDIELSGDVFVNDITIPEGVTARILCAGTITTSCAVGCSDFYLKFPGEVVE